MRGRGRRGHTSAFSRRWACPESARDDYARVSSHRKRPLKKTPVIAHIKARSKHSFLTINRNDLLHTKMEIFYTLTLSRKKKISIIGTLGSGWDRKFYMGTQNGSNNELWSRDFFDSRPRIKVMAFWSLYRKPFTCNVCQKNFTGKRDKFYGRAGYVDDPLPNIVHIAVWVSVWLYYASSSAVWGFRTIFSA